MTGQGVRNTLLSLLRKIVPSSSNGDVEALRKEVGYLRKELEGVNNNHLTTVRKELAILRNEIQENIAAIHRLEILTLSRRIDLLNDFGRTLPNTFPGRTKKSFKPQGYSFGIITNGKRIEKLRRLVKSIRMQRLASDHMEILIAGCVDGPLGLGDVRRFSMVEQAEGGKLGAMRNVLAREARFNKFVCLDDDFLLHPGWAEAVEEVQDDFDIATGIILNPDLSRYCDWVNIIENYTFLRAYHETFDTCQYVTGGYGIYKDFIFAEHSWNDELGFYEGEDVSFSKRLFDAGYQLKFIPRAIVMHDDERYRQKGYGVIRLQSAEEYTDLPDLTLKMEKLCPRTLS
jgi:hypothetical protein